MRVLVADDQTAVRSALRRLLKEEPGLSSVDEAVRVEGLLVKAMVTRPDLVLLDWELPGLPTVEQTRCRFLDSLRALDTHPKVIALSGRPGARRAALDAGADAFVSKGDPPERLLTAIRMINKGPGGDMRDPGQVGDGT